MWGDACRDCTPTHCVVTPEQPIGLACTTCNGRDIECPTCGGSGEQWYTSCPAAGISSDIWELIKLARFARRGTWPVGGGVLDQTSAVGDAFDLIWGEEEKWKAKLRLPHSDANHDG